jgi:hypothetical protein
MFWTLVLMGVSISGVSYVGQFEQEAACQKAQEAARAQSIRAICVQIQKSEAAPAAGAAPVKKVGFAKKQQIFG